MNDMSELLLDPDFVTDFKVKTTSGHRVRGGQWVETAIVVDRHGVIQPAAPKDTQFLPEGDRSRQAIKVYSNEYLSTSDERVPKLGDKITWHDDEHRIVSVKDWSQYGYWQALAVQIMKAQINNTPNPNDPYPPETGEQIDFLAEYIQASN